jgi:hypothetical protein
MPEEDWPNTLRGEAAELYLRWELELRRHGFQLAARGLGLMDSKPGDIRLFRFGRIWFSDRAVSCAHSRRVIIAGDGNPV